MAWKSEGPVLPLASLSLLVPPVRLMAAFVWHTVERHSVRHYDKLLDFIGLVTRLVPELLGAIQTVQLILGLRATLVLELCRGDDAAAAANLHTIQSHLDQIHACASELSPTDHMVSEDMLKTSYTNFASLVQKLVSVPNEKEIFFRDIFPTDYGCDYEQRLQRLVSDFLSRLEQLLPVPDLHQTAAWLTETTSVSEDMGRHLSEPLSLKTLLLHHKQLGTLHSAPSSSEEDALLSTLALPAQTGVHTFNEPYSEDDDDYDNAEVTTALEGLEGEESDNSDWEPKKESGRLSRLFTCPVCSFTHCIKKKVQGHMQSEHHVTAPIQTKLAVKKAGVKPQQNSKCTSASKTNSEGELKKKRKPAQKDCLEKQPARMKKKKKDISENKERRRRKEPTGEDKRFLSMRPVNKNFTEEETKCPKCEKVFEHPNQLKAHAKLHGFPYRCIQCEKGFISSSGYYQHQRLHKKGRMFPCSHCDKGFLCRYSLKQHEKLHAGPSNLCTICGKSFSKAGITRHMQMHRGERNFLCTTCGKSFLTSGELRLHTRSHTGETPHTCTHCGKGFSSKSHMAVHTRSHTGDRPYLCSVCPKRFLTQNCLKRHMLSHNGVKPFKCPSCDKDFSQQGNLKRHLATHKPD